MKFLTRVFTVRCDDTAPKTWHKEVNFTANAPDLDIKPVVIEDGDNGRLDPGETAPVMITLQNSGHATIDGVTVELFPLGEEVRIIGNSFQVYGTIGKGASVSHPFTLQAEDSTPNGYIARFVTSVETLPGLQILDTIEIKIGKTPVLVIDMDPGNHSGPAFFALNELNVSAITKTMYLTNSITTNRYSSALIYIQPC
jgi:hypothetical protein